MLLQFSDEILQFLRLITVTGISKTLLSGNSLQHTAALRLAAVQPMKVHAVRDWKRSAILADLLCPWPCAAPTLLNVYIKEVMRKRRICLRFAHVREILPMPYQNRCSRSGDRPRSNIQVCAKCVRGMSANVSQCPRVQLARGLPCARRFHGNQVGSQRV